MAAGGGWMRVACRGTCTAGAAHRDSRVLGGQHASTVMWDALVPGLDVASNPGGRCRISHFSPSMESKTAEKPLYGGVFLGT